MDAPNLLNNIFVEKAKLVAYRENSGDYTTYVFEKEVYTNELDRYVMCTRFPNWDTPKLSLGDLGFLKYRIVIGGKDEWFNGMGFIKYLNTDIHFLNFIHEKEKIDLIC